MFQRPPVHIQRQIFRFRNDPPSFYSRSIPEKEFFMTRLSNWFDSQFQPPHPSIIRLRALTMTHRERIDLEMKVLRFLRKYVFPDFPETAIPDSIDWFTYRFLITL